MAPVIRPVILCGGSGTRLWPASREAFPKQFAPIIGERSTFQETVLRVMEPSIFGKPLIIAGKAHRFMIERQLAQIGAEADFLLEPVARDSGPAILAAATYLAQHSPGALALVLAADHMVLRPEAFREAVVAGREAARDGAIVTFGIVPTAPATGYGYIEAGAVIAGDVRKVERFVEKPNATRALEYLTKGFLWNSGNFLFAPPRVIEEYQATDPESVATVERAVQLAGLDLGVPTLDREAFVTAKKIAFDFAVMEKTRHAAVVAGDFGWSDIGSWDALWEIAPHDSRGNATSGDVLLTDTDGTYVSAGEQLVATIGVKDLIVVATHDAVLVADRHRSADVKSLVDRLKKDARPEASEHARVYRPWGWYQSLVSKDGFQVKRIVVYPGGKLSLQKHKHRAEHWVIVRGVARVTIAQDVQDLGANQSVYIPLGAVHRLENPGEIDLEVIEVQTGSYLGEDDIIRLEDVYARV